jgi:glycosyltransferase involved in cell wall biosynthesis
VIAAVDQVFAISPGLMEKKGRFNPHAALVPEGVDYHAYADKAPEPADLAAIPSPRLGYTGMLKKHLDWPLLFDLAQKHREWSFVFVGPLNRTHGIEQEIAKLAALANVHFLGEKTVHDLARYPQYFDVCLMPYVVDDYTKYIYPLKLHEYLASGRPVVGSPIRTLQDFSHVIQLADTSEKWSAALTAALAPSERSSARMAARQSVAQAHDWENLVRRIARIQCERLGLNEVSFFETAA